MALIDLALRRHGLGWEPNPPDSRDWDIDRLGLSAVDLPDEVDLTPYIKGIRHQSITKTCVGQGLGGAVDIREVQSGFPYRPASALFPYYHARRKYSRVVTDSGTFIRLAVKSMIKLGIPDETYWPFGVAPWRVNRRPSWEAHMMAHPRRGGAYYAIGGYGAERILAIRTAIASSKPVVFGTKVARSLQPNTGPAIVDRPLISEDIAGGHAMVLVGYRTDPDWGLLFRCLNSWGKGWREGGMCWLTEDYVRWERTRDFTVIDGWDRIRDKQ